MKPNPIRAQLLTALLVGMAVAGWVFLAPSQFGGSTTYVVTHGTSMEPRFHTGDLAIVRPASEYRVGEVVAYHSSLLHVIVLHRIIALHDGHYTFKGDNNNFVDPVHPTRAMLVGQLWLRVPHGGLLLDALHSPLIAGGLLALVGGLALLGSGPARRRRRRRRHDQGQPSGTAMTPATPPFALHPRRAAMAAALVTAALVLACAAAFVMPTSGTVLHRVLYQQQARFTYSATVPASTVYPTGMVSTGTPVFTSIVHRLRVTLRYRVTSAASTVLRGSERVLVTLTGPTGWSRIVAGGPARRFAGGRFTDGVTLDLPALEAVLGQVQQLTGLPDAGAAVKISAAVRLHGRVAGRPFGTRFAPSLSFQMQPLQLQPGAGAGTVGQPGSTVTTPPSAAAASGFSPSAAGAVTTDSEGPNTLGPGGYPVSVSALRILAVAALILSIIATAILMVLARRRGAFDETTRIQSLYGHLLVPISTGEDLGWPPVDVPAFTSLVRLAEAGGLVILHHHGEDADTYLVNDDGTVYRYQARQAKVIWGEWTEHPPALVA